MHLVGRGFCTREGVRQHVADGLGGVGRGGQHFADRQLAGLIVDQDQVGERAADVHADPPHQRPGNFSSPKMSTVADRCCASMPPVQTIDPVTYCASSEARKTAGPAMSSGEPMRASGTLEPRFRRSSSGRPLVSIEPGTSVQTRTP